MDFSDWLELCPNELKVKLENVIADFTGLDGWIDLYNILITRATTDAEEVASIADSIAVDLEARGLAFEAIIFFELVARSSWGAGNFDNCFSGIRKMVELDIDQGSREDILEIVRLIGDEPDSFGSSLDHRPRVYAAVMQVLRHYELEEEIAQLHLRAANTYSRNGASQAAYRSISDAENIANEIESSSLLAEVYGTAVATACEENDHEWAVKTGQRAITVLNSIGELPSSELLSNLGVAYMRLEQYDEAVAFLRASLSASTDNALSAAIQVNLAACLRSSGDVEAAWETVLKAENIIEKNADPERRLEFSLVAARIAAERQSIAEFVVHLNEAIIQFNLGLKDTLRLHHRRGFRERYISRIEGLLREFPQKGRAADVLPALTIVRANALGDWLSILDWASFVEAEVTIDAIDKQAVASAMYSLRNFGAPHLYGFREKYDDAWQPMNRGAVWDELSIIAERLESHGHALPTARMDIDVLLNNCRERLIEGHALMALTYAGESAVLWCIVGDQYVSTRISVTILYEWWEAARAHALNTISRTEFDARIRNTIDSFWLAAEPMLDVIAQQSALSIRYLQDFSESPPITALVLKHELLAERMMAGTFQVRIVTALYKSDEHALEIPHVLAISNSDEELLLSVAEGPTFAEIVLAAEFRQFDAEADIQNTDILRKADVILVSTHSSPLTFYTDAYFATMGKKGDRHPINVESLQMHAPEWKSTLVMLNACHSGSGVARNFQQSFRTADIVTFPAMFTLNRRSIVSAGAWKLSDTVSFLFTTLVARAMCEGCLPSVALAKSIATLPKLKKEDAVCLLKHIADPVVRAQSIDRLANAPAEGLFSAPYVSGGLAIHGLL
jgi:tetratricopeptide (TPR) repeat protein